MLDGEGVNGGIFVDAGVAFTTVQGAGEGGGQLANQAVVREPEVAQLQCKADEVREEVGCVNAAVDEDGAVYVRV